MISTKANAVKAPTPGCVITRRASGHFSTSCSTAWLNSVIVGFSRSINSSRSRRRRLAHGASRIDFQLLPPVRPPQPLLTAQPFVQRHRLQLVHDSRARLHHAVPVPQQLPQIPVLPARHPDLRKIILQHEFQNQLRVLPIRFAFALVGLRISAASPIQSSNLQLGQQSFEPASVPTGFDPTRTFCPPKLG